MEYTSTRMTWRDFKNDGLAPDLYTMVVATYRTGRQTKGFGFDEVMS